MKLPWHCTLAWGLKMVAGPGTPVHSAVGRRLPKPGPWCDLLVLEHREALQTQALNTCCDPSSCHPRSVLLNSQGQWKCQGTCVLLPKMFFFPMKMLLGGKAALFHQPPRGTLLLQA